MRQADPGKLLELKSIGDIGAGPKPGVFGGGYEGSVCAMRPRAEAVRGAQAFARAAPSLEAPAAEGAGGFLIPSRVHDRRLASPEWPCSTPRSRVDLNPILERNGQMTLVDALIAAEKSR